MKDWEENVRKVVPYTPGEQPRDTHVVKLNTNENPYPPAPGVRKVLQSMDVDSFRLYPDPAAQMLTEALAHYYGIDKDQVFVGVGSDDVLSVAFLTFFNSSRPLLFPDITYSFYPVWADVYRIPYRKVPLDEQFHIRPEDYRQENGGIVFPNPNAPTSCLETLDTVEEILKANRDVVVIVDEAYIDFGGESALKLIDQYDNLLVVQTFSKSRSMAGVRIGYAMGCKELIQAMNDVKYSINSYTMSRPAILLGTAAVADEAYFKQCIRRIIATREKTEECLLELGFTFPKPYANFIFAKHPQQNGKELFASLRKEHIYVRHFDQPRIEDYLRITIGTDEQMETLFKALEKML